MNISQAAPSDHPGVLLSMYAQALLWIYNTFQKTKILTNMHMLQCNIDCFGVFAAAFDDERRVRLAARAGALEIAAVQQINALTKPIALV